MGLAAGLERLAAAHLLFPTAIVTVGVTGFVVGRPLDGWVLPLSALISVVLLRSFCNSWREVSSIALLAAVLHIAAGLGAVALPDGSWDGLAYHQEAILRLAAGWNPIFEKADGYGWGANLYLNHYPKGPWIASAAVLLSTGYVEAGKLFNGTLMIAAGALATSALLRLTSLRTAAAAGLGVLAALNPVVVYQSTTFYIDGAVGSLMSVLVAGLVVFGATARWQPLVVALLAVCLVINAKFTGLVYAAVLLAMAVPVVGWLHGRGAAYRFTAAAAAAGMVGVLLLGYAPYVRNTLEYGAPFYSIIPPPKHRPDNLILQRPVNLNDRNRFTRFVLSNLSRTEAVRPPLGTRLKFPLALGAEERHGTYGADLESGGFGPLYAALMLLAIVCATTLVVHPATRMSGGWALLIAVCILVSIFTHSETWWARFVPQAWLLPIIVAAASLGAARRSLGWWLGVGLVVLASANLLIVGANVGWRRLVYARDMHRTLHEMANAPRPVAVSLHPFISLRRRLLEADLEFRVVDTPPGAHQLRHAIPSAGNQAFWIESR